LLIRPKSKKQQQRKTKTQKNTQKIQTKHHNANKMNHIKSRMCNFACGQPSWYILAIEENNVHKLGNLASDLGFSLREIALCSFFPDGFAGSFSLRRFAPEQIGRLRDPFPQENIYIEIYTTSA